MIFKNMILLKVTKGRFNYIDLHLGTHFLQEKHNLLLSIFLEVILQNKSNFAYVIFTKEM